MLLPMTSRPTSASVMVAIAVAQLAISLFEMFASKGPSIGDLINLQWQMLMNLSAQMENMQQELAEIIAQLEDLKKLVEGVPVEAVRKQYQTKLRSQLGNFQEMMGTYARVKEEKSEAEARKELKRLPEVLEPIRDCRHALVLPDMENESVIPLMASAMQAEILAMILLGKEEYSDATIQTALMAYKAWFGHWLDPAFDRNLPAQCRAINAKMIAEKNESDQLFRGLFGRICFRNLHYTDLDPDLRVFNSLSYDEVTLIFEDDDTYPDFIDWLGKLRKKGLLFPEPLDRVARRTVSVATRHVERAPAGESERHMKEIARRQGDSAQCQGTPEAAVDRYAKFRETFDLQSSKLLAMYSFLLIVSTSRAACDAFYAKIAARART